MESTLIADRLPTVRSALSNGKRMHQKGTDGRSTVARRFKDLVISLAAPLGGERALNESDRALVRTAATLTLRSEQLQAAAVSGAPIDSEELTRLANSVRGVLATLRRRAKPEPVGLTAPIVAAGAPAPAPDLSGLSNEELDRLHALLIEARSGEGSPS
jgi:hypothetical protein